MTHQMIRRFSITAIYSEKMLIRTRDTCHNSVVGMMRDEGYVPLYDINPVWQSTMREDEKFAGTYTMQGVYVGEEEAWQIDGMVDGKLIRSTPKSK